MEELRQKIAARAAQARKTANRAKKELDQKILELTNMRFEKIRSALADKQRQWEAEGDVVFRLAEKVLNRARAIRESLATGSPEDLKKPMSSDPTEAGKVDKVEKSTSSSRNMKKKKTALSPSAKANKVIAKSVPDEMGEPKVKRTRTTAGASGRKKTRASKNN